MVSWVFKNIFLVWFSFAGYEKKKIDDSFVLAFCFFDELLREVVVVIAFYHLCLACLSSKSCR